MSQRRATSQRRIDRQIRAANVRVIAADGTNLGVRDLADALELADDAGLHLVEIAPNAEPPVCKICDPGKLAYEEARAAREKRRAGGGPQTHRQHEIKLRPQTADGDLRTKLGRVAGFLDAGDTVRIVVMLRGRQVSRDGDADAVVDRIRTQFADVADIDGPHRSGRDVRLTLRPAAH